MYLSDPITKQDILSARYEQKHPEIVFILSLPTQAQNLKKMLDSYLHFRW